MARVTAATSQNVRIQASAKEVQAFRASGQSAKLIQGNVILLTQGQFVSAFGRTGRIGQSFDIFSGQFVTAAPEPELEEQLITEAGQLGRPAIVPAIGAGVRPSGEIIREIPARVTRAPPLETIGIGAGVQPSLMPRREAEEIFERATPIEKAGLIGTTLLGPRGFELLGAIPSLPPIEPGRPPKPLFETIFERQAFEAPKPFEAEIMPEEVVFRRIEDLLKFEPEKVTIRRPVPKGLGIEFKEFELELPREFVAAKEAAVTGPIFEIETFFLGGAAFGAATRIPRVAKVLTTPFVQDIGKIASGVFLGREAISTGEIFAEGRVAEARGRALSLGAGLFALGKGFRVGERVGELKIGIPKKAEALVKRGLIPKRAEEIIKFGAEKGFEFPRTTRFLTEPEEVAILGARPGVQRRVLAEIKAERAEIFGSVAQEAQLAKASRRLVKDIDVAVSGSRAQVSAAKRVFKKAAAGEIKLDVKEKARLEEFLFREKPIITPRGQKITGLREQALRKLTGAVTEQRIARKGLKEVEDLERIIRQTVSGKKVAGKPLTKAEQKFIGARPFKAPKVKPIKEPSIPSSLLPSKLPRSLIPSAIGVKSFLPSRLRPSKVPRRAPSLLPPRMLLPSFLPPKLPRLPPSILPPKRPPSRLPPSLPPSRLPPRLPPFRPPPSRLPPRKPPKIPPIRPPSFFFEPFKKERIKPKRPTGFRIRVVKHKIATPSELIFGRGKRGRKAINVLDLI